MRSLFAFTAVLLLTGHLARAQQQAPVSGMVRDSASGTVLEGAVVTFVEVGKRDSARSLTDARGRFQINREAHGEFVLLFSYVGYQTRGYQYPASSRRTWAASTWPLLLSP